LKVLQRYFVFKTNTTISNTTIYHPVFNKSNTTGISSGAAATAYPIGIPEFIPDFHWIRVRKDMDVNEHERLSNIINTHKLNTGGYPTLLRH